jgi:hypothetical protein
MKIILATALIALGQIESNDNDHAIGAHGEVSRYQIMPAVWRQHQHAPIHKASDPRVSTAIARAELTNRIRFFFSHTHREPTPFDLYVLWNYGIVLYYQHNFDPTHIPATIRERATRFANLYEQLNKPSERGVHAASTHH